jgi:uncharacterized protein
MTELPFYFQRGDARLFGILHAPAPGVSAARTAFVMSHPFGEEKLWSHRVFVTFARALAQRGHYTLRFDYMGAGDSSGETPEASLQTHLADLRAGVDQLLLRASNIDSVGLIGLRLGASIAAMFADSVRETDQYPKVQRGPLILWDPVIDGENYFQELLRTNLSTQLSVFGKVQESREVLIERIRGGGTANVDGYEIGLPLFESCARQDLLPSAGMRHEGRTLVVQIAANDKAKLREDLEAFAKGSANASFERAIEQPFWREIKPFYGRAGNLQALTLQWLEQQGA